MQGPARDTLVASGDSWTLTARAEDAGIFVDLQTRGGGSAGRVALGNPGQGAVIAWGGHVVSGEPFFLSGFTHRDVAGVRILLSTGNQMTVRTMGQDAGFSVVFYVAKLPLNARPVAITAVGERGDELERLDTSLSLAV